MMSAGGRLPRIVTTACFINCFEGALSWKPTALAVGAKDRGNRLSPR
jgi:hypothetical protein